MVESSKRVPGASLYELFDFLARPMEDAREKQIGINRREALSFSALAYFDNPEPKQTEIIASLLEPKGKHCQGTLFLRHLLASVWPSLMPHEWPQDVLERAKVRPNHFIPGDYGKGKRKRFVDLWIQVGKDRCLVIESKAKDAEDQPGQLDAYLDHMKRCFPASRNCKLLYLSPNGEGPDPMSISAEEWKEARVGGIADARPYALFVREWLDGCRKDCEAERVKFFIDPNARRSIDMTAPLNPSIRELLFDSQQEDRRETLLSIWELSEQIYEEILKSFQRNLCERLVERNIKYTFGDVNGLLSKQPWGGFIKGPQAEFISSSSGERLIAYAAIQRSPSGFHNRPRPHLIVGINIEGLNDTKYQAKLRPWRELAQRSGFPVGTDDKNWVWQQVPDGFDDLSSKDTAIRLLDPNSATDIVEQMQDWLMAFVEAAGQDND
jgi:hypothetical protein